LLSIEVQPAPDVDLKVNAAKKAKEIKGLAAG
jgi:hypothetical protein